VLDTMRADRLAPWGETRRLAPFLESLAERGTVFRHAYAQTSWTAGSVASIFTSRYLLQHGVTAFNKKLPDSEVTLAETLKAAGYNTGAFSANGLITPNLNFNQGYDIYRAYAVKITSEPNFMWFPPRADFVNAEALKWLDLQPRNAPFFLYLQYMEPHTPYDPPAELLAKLRGTEPGPSMKEVNAAAWMGNSFAPNPMMMQAIQDYYDAAIMAMDAEIAKLFGELEARGLLRNTLIVITADHGEEFREHGIMGHGKSLYDIVLHVPLIIVPPGGGRATVRDEVVQLVDVAPTVVDWAGSEPPATFEGRSLRPWVETGRRSFFARDAQPPPPRPALSELERLAEGDAKVIKHHRAFLDPERRKTIRRFEGDPLWFDQQADPGETDPNALAPAQRDALSEGLDGLLGRLQQRTGNATTIELDAETRERLKALGYAH
jgi:arylsulfatase A-like enzyme